MRRLLKVASVPLALVLLVVVLWLLDAPDGGEPVRNVEVAGRSIGGDAESVASAVADVGAAYADSEVVIRTGDGDIETTAAAIGLEVDVDATIDRALAVGRDDPLPFRPVRWLTSLISAREAGVTATVDRSKLRALVASEDPTGHTPPTEPGITGDDGQIGVVLGEDGEGLDADEIADAIESAAGDGALPIEVDAEPHALEPRFTRADAEALADKARGLTSSPVAVTAGETEAEIPGSTIRSWLRSEPGDDELELALDADEVLADLAKLLGDAGTQPENARLTVVGGRPQIVGGVEGTSCCGADAVGYLLGAVKAGHSGPVRLPLARTQPDVTRDELEKLEIVEAIGSFTTRHKCCESRVTNIHRIADLVRGVVVGPGESFSVNGHVGKRTEGNGFVSGGAIEQGSFTESVGGGISQFATTLFNAAFFGGLDLKEYQSHSIYISRYPYGREATLSYPKPDLVVGNSTPHGVLIWPTYNSSSITVTLYSTRFARGEQTAQTEAPFGKAGCKRVKTERTRTYRDGTTKVDSVYAVYRPAEGIQCDGPANQTTTTTTAPPPPEETTTTQPPNGG